MLEQVSIKGQERIKAGSRGDGVELMKSGYLRGEKEESRECLVRCTLLSTNLHLRHPNRISV